MQYVRALVYVLVIIALCFAGFVVLVEHPQTRAPVRCWLSETFYDLSYEDAPPGTPVVEVAELTEPVNDMCDAADDPAIWVNPQQPTKSLVIGTNKQSRLNTYDLVGKRVGSTDEIGAPNNADLRLFGQTVIVAASDKDDSEIEIFSLDANTANLNVIKGAPFPAQVEKEVYGACLYQTSEQLYAFITDKSGMITQYEITQNTDGWENQHLRTLRVDSQPEGCVVDDQQHILFVGEEDKGIWQFDARPEASTEGTLIASVKPEGELTADVEGLALYIPTDGGQGYLIASSQGDHTYAVYDRFAPFAFRGRFQLSHKGRMIGDTDGLEVVSQALGDKYPKGMLVVQDGLFRDPQGKRRYQRFAYVSWADVEAALNLTSTIR